MNEPRYQRRKDDRPGELAEAALVEFANNGYAATRVGDVAKRAGVSKGLLYLYYKTKEDLFKAVIKNIVAPRIARLQKIVEESEQSAEDFFRGPFLEFIKTLPDSKIRVLVRLMIAEGHRHPELVQYHYENVVNPGLNTLQTVIRRGVANGEFRESSLEEFPQLLAAPVVMSVIWKLLFEVHHPLDTERMLETHVDQILTYLKTDTPGATG